MYLYEFRGVIAFFNPQWKIELINHWRRPLEDSAMSYYEKSCVSYIGHVENLLSQIVKVQ